MIIFLFIQTSKKGDENNNKQLATIAQMKNLPIPESKLDQRIQNLIQLICDVRAMEEALLEMKFDARKNPLGKNEEFFLSIFFFFSGKLSSTQIKAGYAALKSIEKFIKANKFHSDFIEANNTYYTRSTYHKPFRKSIYFCFSLSST
jgi:poly [ADP-ribose] polymerase